MHYSGCLIYLRDYVINMVAATNKNKQKILKNKSKAANHLASDLGICVYLGQTRKKKLEQLLNAGDKAEAFRANTPL